MKALLIRFKTSDEGTQGVFISNGFSCYTLELPWRDNKPCISCIPEGDYKCVPHLWHGRVQTYHLLNVPNRSGILIHSGNWAGDIHKGYKSHSEGCILVGKYFGRLYNQLAVLNSRTTLSELVNHFDFKPFELRIINGVTECC